MRQPGPSPAVAVRGVSKTFSVPHEARHTLKERVLHPLRKSGHDRFEAVKDVSFDIAPGEFFGVVGRNGSGKSTLLKCMAGIYGIDRGAIYIDGRMSTFIELGVGFNPDLAARENIVLNGIMLGLTPREARARVDKVIEFAELEEFTELKLKNYSSGMHVRLAFSVMIQVDADILLIDEVLAVGDAAFQQKCFDVFNRMRDEGKTILLVTHDMGAVTRFCHRAALLENGDLVAVAAPDEIAYRYLELNFGRQAAEDASGRRRGGDGAAAITDVWIEDAAGEPATTIQQGASITVRAKVRFAEEVDDPSFSVVFVDEEHRQVFRATTQARQERTGHFAPGETVVFSIAFEVPFRPARYELGATLAHRGSGDDAIDTREDTTSIVVVGARATGGLVDLPYEIEIEPAAATPATEPVESPAAPGTRP